MGGVWHQIPLKKSQESIAKLAWLVCYWQLLWHNVDLFLFDTHLSCPGQQRSHESYTLDRPGYLADKHNFYNYGSFKVKNKSDPLGVGVF